jgi:hypothetical protein
MSRIDRDDLRKLVREALKEALGAGATLAAAKPQRDQAAPPSSASDPPEQGFVATLRAALGRGALARVPVTIKASADVDRFARDVAEASGHPELRAAILSGRLGFDLAGTAAVPSERKAPNGGAYEIKSGVLSETKIVEIARSHRKIIIGAGVVLTPLARDKAREMKVELTRQKP